jgi:hypothetical protein
MPLSCFGYRNLPDGAIAIEKITRYGEKLLDRAAHRRPLSQNERDYLLMVVGLLNAVLWEQTAHPDYLERHTFRGARGELAYRMSVWWFAVTSEKEWAPKLRTMRDVVARVAAGTSEPADYPALPDVIAFLHGMNTVVSRAYNV